jgi:hypothetical protein
MFVRRSADFGDHLSDLPDAENNLFHCLASSVHEPAARLNALCALTNQRLDFASRVGASACQASNLACREAATLLACSCGFNGGVQSEDIGLERDSVDHTDDFGDARSASADV